MQCGRVYDKLVVLDVGKTAGDWDQGGQEASLATLATQAGSTHEQQRITAGQSINSSLVTAGLS